MRGAAASERAVNATVKPDETVLSIKDCQAYYGAFHVIKGVSLDVKRGETVAVVQRVCIARALVAKPDLITHDLDVVHRIAHRTAVMLQGQSVAFDQTDKIFDNPEHAYTQKLITAVPEMRID